MTASTQTPATQDKNKTPATVKQTLPANATAAERAALEYTDDRDEFLSRPFSHNTSLAKAGAAFTIHKIGERIIEPNEVNQNTENMEAYVYLIELQEPYDHADRQTGELKKFAGGDLQVLSIAKNAIREADFRKLSSIVAQHGSIPNMALQEYPAKDKKFSNPVGIVHKVRWQTVAEIAKQRGLV